MKQEINLDDYFWRVNPCWICRYWKYDRRPDRAFDGMICVCEDDICPHHEQFIKGGTFNEDTKSFKSNKEN